MKTIIFCAALPNEISFLCRHYNLQIPTPHSPIIGPKKIENVCFYVLTSGIGQNRMSETLNTFSINYVDCWISAGIAGSLVPDAKCGECLMGTSVISLSGKQFGFNIPFPIEKEFETRALLCVERLVSDPHQKRDLHRRSGAVLVNMESIAVAEHAAQRHEPFLWIKAVSDELDENMPIQLLRCMNAQGYPSIQKSIAMLLRNPFYLPKVIALGRKTQSLNRKLAHTAIEIVSRLNS